MERVVLTTTPRSRLGATCWYTTDTVAWVRHHSVYVGYPLVDHPLLSPDDRDYDQNPLCLCGDLDRLTTPPPIHPNEFPR